MNLHLPLPVPTHHEDAPAVVVRPVVYSGSAGPPLLLDVVVERRGAGGREATHLAPDQVPAAHARLSQVVGSRLDAPAIVDGTSPEGTAPVVHLTSAEVAAVARDLEAIALVYLHENVWGGEDARKQ
jgi:hypothetical protein